MACIRNLKRVDVPTTVSKMAPEHCSVYVVHKEKLMSVKSAQRPIINTITPPKLPLALPQQLSIGQADQGSILYAQATLNAQKQSKDGYRRRSNVSSRSISTMATNNHPELFKKSRIESPRVSISDDLQEERSQFGSIDMTSLNMDFSMPDVNRDERRSTSNELEEEMRKLRLELKQTMDLYNTACKEAISAKEKAKELGERKTEEGRRRQQARAVEEEAMAMVEKEKDKCRAAMEAAEAAQRLAEMESQRRILAEKKAKKETEDKNRALAALAQHDTRYRKYTIDEIEEGTHKLSPSFKIGEGGYGPVYKGTLDHTPVAIKVLRPDAAQGKKQFHQEVEVLSTMRHPHMVLLLGACPEYGCLVYEYMNNGSLEDRLFRRGNTPTIPWRIRFNISAEIVTALNFLHQAKPEPLVHRDLKPANILLDRNYVSKISDVGLARLVPPSVANSVTQYHMTAAAGTFCYIDPEYQQSGMLTTKSDVYSLGIMLLQILTARPPMGLSHHVDRAIKRGNFESMLDPSVPDWPLDAAMRFAKLALKCSELRKKDRPDLGNEVLPELIRLQDYAMEDGT
ncbi:hypothetical protein V2J09_009366 [Rumex salicifolius]